MDDDGSKSKSTSSFEVIELGPVVGIVNASYENTENNDSGSTEHVVSGNDVENGDALVIADRPATGKAEVQLIYTQVEKLPLRDFYHEVRPMLDVEHYLFDTKIMLDLDQVSMEDIVGELLREIFPEERLRKAGIVEDCKRLMFTDSDSLLLADVLQGMTSTGNSSSLRDPNWLIALCDLPMIKKTRIGLARLKDPVNFGPDAASVQFLCLVIGATEEVSETIPDIRFSCYSCESVSSQHSQTRSVIISDS